MGFFRQQQENMAEKLLRWQYKKRNLPEPDPMVLKQQAKKIVGDALRIARESGSNIMVIIKDLVKDLKSQ